MSTVGALALTGAVLLALACAKAMASTSRHLWGSDRKRHVRQAWALTYVGSGLLVASAWWAVIA